ARPGIASPARLSPAARFKTPPAPLLGVMLEMRGRSPSPLNGERAGVRGENRLLRSTPPAAPHSFTQSGTGKTVETVAFCLPAYATSLKRGVNERRPLVLAKNQKRNMDALGVLPSIVLGPATLDAFSRVG